jgi:hypothetical protein
MVRGDVVGEERRLEGCDLEARAVRQELSLGDALSEEVGLALKIDAAWKRRVLLVASIAYPVFWAINDDLLEESSKRQPGFLNVSIAGFIDVVQGRAAPVPCDPGERGRCFCRRSTADTSLVVYRQQSRGRCLEE